VREVAIGPLDGGGVFHLRFEIGSPLGRRLLTSLLGWEGETSRIPDQFMRNRRAETLFDAEVAGQDPALDLVGAHLRRILEGDKLPLLSMDLDDTFLPFGKIINERELETVVAYAQAGGQLAFNTLAPKEWFYLRVIERLVHSMHRNNCTHLLCRLHWIASGGREIFVYDSSNHGYRRIYAASTGSKTEGLLHLLRHLKSNVSLLAFYGDRFDDPENDGNALGIREIPLVINVGADQQLPQANAGQIFLNAVEKGPATTLRHMDFLTAKLRERPPPVLQVQVSTLHRESPAEWRLWRFEASPYTGKPDGVEVDGPGFVWSWSHLGLSYLTTLVRPLDNSVSKMVYRAPFPCGVAGFTFFWTGGPDTASGQLAGHWEGRDFLV
jgi:hypothetical protein